MTNKTKDTGCMGAAVSGKSLPHPGQIRMIGLDLDGTTFNRAGQITERTRRAIAEAIRQGVVVLPATGRPFCGLPSSFLEIPGVTYALTSNGARILNFRTGEELVLELIPWETAVRLLAEVDQWEGCVWEAYFGGNIYVDKDSYQYLVPAGMTTALKEYIERTRQGRPHLIQTLREEKISLEKIHMIFKDTGVRDEKMANLQRAYPELDVSCAVCFNIEINSARAGKGKSLLKLGEILGIGRDGIMAGGDAANDWDMLREAGFAVVMDNADPETKKLADYVTGSNEEDGIAEAIEKFVIK